MSALKQNEIITASNGTGVVSIRECSNNPAISIPCVTLFRKEWIDDSTGHIYPAASFEVIDAKALFETLAFYFNSTHANHDNS